MARRFRLTAAAARDVAEIARFTQRRWGKAQRRRYLRDLEARMNALADNPSLGLAREEIFRGLRSARAGSHIVFYRATKDGILVARVLHESMDATRHLGGEAGERS